MSTRRERAIHEAGHTVAAHRSGKRIELVSITGTGQVQGFCLFMENTDPVFAPEEIAAAATVVASTMDSRPTRPSYSAEEVERRLLIALAGPEAQRKESGGRWTPPGDEYDMQKANELLGADRRSAWDVCSDLADARERTRALLAEHWEEVEAVAYALQCSGTLTGDQVRLLLDSATAPRMEMDATARGDTTAQAPRARRSAPTQRMARPMPFRSGFMRVFI